jgi:hypothetical protein
VLLACPSVTHFNQSTNSICSRRSCCHWRCHEGEARRPPPPMQARRHRHHGGPHHPPPSPPVARGPEQA